MRHRLSELAESDLREIWRYVAADTSVERTDRLLEAIGDGLDLLAEHPRIGRRRPEFGAGVRSFAVENHVIYYGVLSYTGAAREKELGFGSRSAGIQREFCDSCSRREVCSSA
jgi:toxin ParE1/3/4